ncbi:unnamed protein product [Haemonchus placei]|uniref:Uncharacterized protein n=1 Tax=Haemonchus placei TaxID=6290 RepID=A0A0N4WXF8_HAEPC|nr:unnamed protein product [Haemonchus placei]
MFFSFAMRFLLFLILIRFHYASGDSECGIPLLEKECNEDKDCAKDSKGHYEFPGTMTYCNKAGGHGAP